MAQVAKHFLALSTNPSKKEQKEEKEGRKERRKEGRKLPKDIIEKNFTHLNIFRSESIYEA
jgi:hypothetical protein